MIREIASTTDIDDLLALSETQPVLLLKHSTTCPISASAYKQFNAFISNNSLQSDENRHSFIPALVKVIESRPASLALAERLHVTHQSPQLILIVRGRAVTHFSHWHITQKAIAEALKHEAL